MDKKFCTKCGQELSEDAKFCPECGFNVQAISSTIKDKNKKKKSEKKFNWKLLIIILAIIFVLGIVAVVVFALLSSSNLQDSVKTSKNTIAVKIGNTEVSDNIGNLPGNIAAGALSVYKNDTLFFAADDGIYKTDQITDLIEKKNCSKVIDGSFTYLNIHDNNLFCIDNKNNAIVKFLNVFDEDKPKKEIFYQGNEQSKILEIGISNNYIFCVLSLENSFTVATIKCDNSSSVGEVFTSSGNRAWLKVSDNSIIFCLSDSSSWTAWNIDMSSGQPSKAVKLTSGNGQPVDMAFSDSKIYCAEKTSSDSSGKIIVLDNSGSRQEINLDCKISKLLLCGETVFAHSSKKKFIWFNTDTSMSHDIENEDFDDSEIACINLNHEYFCVLYKNGKIVTTDVNKLH